ncbi:MAG: hypothetical protein IJ367_03030 [Clostridia bacterium]|nr:hypothetical protein [Clostridia bacterium]
MNYIAAINHFEMLNRRERFTPSAQLLWYRLMHVANRKHWPQQFEESNSDLLETLGVTRKTLQRARDELIHREMITYMPGKGNKSGRYILLYKRDTANVTFSPSEGENGAKKEKNQKKEKNNKYIYKTKRLRETDSQNDSRYDFEAVKRASFLKLMRDTEKTEKGSDAVD